MPPANNTHSNPYAQAAGTYGGHAQKHTPDQRELEARVLQKATRMLQDIQNNWDEALQDKERLPETLKYNRQIWLLFYDTALENPDGDRPSDLRSNIVNLANFIFKHEMDILAKPEKSKLNILIEINSNIAAGLMDGVRNDAANSKSQKPQEKQTAQGSGTEGSSSFSA